MVMGRHKYGPFLLLLPPEQLAVITLHQVLSSIMVGTRSRSAENPDTWKLQAGKTRLTALAYDIGKVGCHLLPHSEVACPSCAEMMPKACNRTALPLFWATSCCWGLADISFTGCVFAGDFVDGVERCDG